MIRLNKLYLILLLSALVSGCSSLPKQEPVEEAPIQSAEVVQETAGPAIDETYYEKAKSLLEAKDYPGIVALNDSAVSAGINTARLWNISGVANRYQGNLKKAEKNYLSALEQSPEHLNSLMNLAILYDIYLQDLSLAMQYYLAYQNALAKQGKTNSQLANWIADLKTRLAKSGA